VPESSLQMRVQQNWPSGAMRHPTASKDSRNFEIGVGIGGATLRGLLARADAPRGVLVSTRSLLTKLPKALLAVKAESPRTLLTQLKPSG
jgi:hypothetical protein